MKYILSSSIAIQALFWVTSAHAQSIASQEKTITGGTITIVAYIALWLLIFGTVFAILRNQRSLQDDLNDLRKRMDDVLDIDDKA